MYGTLLLIITLIVVTVFWRDSLRAREAAARACKSACQSYSVQFLDDTVSLSYVRPRRCHGRLTLRRVYEFEFSRNGTERARASITMSGHEVESIYLPAPSEGDRPT